MKVQLKKIALQILFWLCLPLVTTFLWWLFQYTTLPGIRAGHRFGQVWQDALEFNLTLVVTGAASFYFTYYIPRLPKADQRPILVCYGLLVFLLPPLILAVYSWFSLTVAIMFRYFLYFGYFITVVFVIAALAIRYLNNWVSTRNALVSADQNAAAMELQLLKSHLSPHFLFNTINNIDSMIMREPEKASDYLNKLAELLRFMLYRTQAPSLRLVDELTYIREYMDLQRIRSVSTDYCRLEICGEPGNWQVVPLLFLPLVENAFKHCTSKSVPQAIIVRFNIQEAQIAFRCENIYDPGRATQDTGGLGTNLVERRLELSYPGSYSLKKSHTDGRYAVNLTIHK